MCFCLSFSPLQWLRRKQIETVEVEGFGSIQKETDREDRQIQADRHKDIWGSGD